MGIHNRIRKESDTKLLPIEAVLAGFMTLCEQYKQMGEQLKFLSGAVTALRDSAPKLFKPPGGNGEKKG